MSQPFHEWIEATDISRVELQGDGLSPHPGYQADDFFGFRPIGVVGEDRVDPTRARLSTVLRPRPRLPPVTTAILFLGVAVFRSVMFWSFLVIGVKLQPKVLI
jgi:hypothetical protein